MANAAVLHVDADESERTAASEALAERGLVVETAATLAAAVDAIEERAFDCVVSAHELPDGTGLDLLARLRETRPDAAFVLFTDTTIEEIDTGQVDGDVGEYVDRGRPDAHGALADLVAGTVERRGQTAYPLPADETERLAALDRYAEDSEALDEALDRLAAFATAALDVSMAGVGVVAEHEQRFLACRGVDLDAVPREETVCTHAMLDDEVTVIEDIRADPRFAANEGLRELGIRLYASANVTTPEGAVLGTFCVYDDEPGTLDESERELLSLFADEAAEQFELRRRLREAGADG